MKGISMENTKSISPISSDKTKLIKHKVNWHEAAACAIRIELRDYENLLEFKNEYVFGKNNYRIDMLIVKKLTSKSIPKNIARNFKAYNLFEFRGIGSSINTNSYYKAIGYAGILISHIRQEIYTKYLNQITRANSMKKGEPTMVCEGLFELYGTTSQEFYDRGRQEAENLYLPKIE